MVILFWGGKNNIRLQSEQGGMHEGTSRFFIF